MAGSVPDPHPLQAFQAALVTRHPLTQRAYRGTIRDFLAWLTMQPGGNPFRFEALTQTAVQGYLGPEQTLAPPTASFRRRSCSHQTSPELPPSCSAVGTRKCRAVRRTDEGLGPLIRKPLQKWLRLAKRLKGKEPFCACGGWWRGCLFRAH